MNDQDILQNPTGGTVPARAPISSLSSLSTAINDALSGIGLEEAQKNLYQPVQYLLGLGGKRIRPLLCLMAYRLFSDAELGPAVLKPAAAIEVFHNFTLMHDDIMDHAPLRRGQPTVHAKWDTNTAILSGDVMLIQAYELLVAASPTLLPEVLETFNTCARKVCEGQQWDMDYESKEDVNVADYLNMIQHKTAVLLGFSLQLGGLLAQCQATDRQLLEKAGTALGMAFQLKDDLLDVYGEQQKVGKQVAGDILCNKKTILLTSALAMADDIQKKTLLQQLKNKTRGNPQQEAQKITVVKGIYDELSLPKKIAADIQQYSEEASAAIQALSTPEEEAKSAILDLFDSLLNRSH